jgi:hypothetical protein
MNSDKNNSAKISAAPLQTVQLPKDKSQSEAMFLKEQSANAKAAIKQAIGDFGRGLGHGVDPRAWTQQYPWMSLGAAAVAGFVAASAVVPSKEQQALKRLERIEKALHPEQHEPKHERVESDGKKVEKKGFLSAIAGDLIKAVGPALASALTAGMTAQATTEAATDGNGHAPDIASNDPSI